MDKDLSFSPKQIENRIYSIRGIRVMLDSHLAEIHNVTAGRVNEQVKRNGERFPEDFMFQLTQVEWDILIARNAKSSLRSQNASLKDERGKHPKYLPNVFTEQGVAGLSGVLKSETAAKVDVTIMRAFVAMRKLIQENLLIYDRLDRLELKQFLTNQQFEQIF